MNFNNFMRSERPKDSNAGSRFLHAFRVRRNWVGA